MFFCIVINNYRKTPGGAFLFSFAAMHGCHHPARGNIAHHPARGFVLRRSHSWLPYSISKLTSHPCSSGELNRTVTVPVSPTLPT